MRKLSFLLLFCTFTFIISSAALATEPGNIQDTKDAVVKYYDLGGYTHDISTVIANAKNYMDTRINHKNIAENKKLAVVLDIDDTSLSTYKRLKALSFGGNIDLWHAGELEGKDPAVPEVLSLYNYAIKHNVSIFFITGRIDKEKQATEQNLKNAGYTTWTNVYYKPENYSATHKSISDYKAQTRKRIEDSGYDIVLNIGDQKSDLDGGYADKAFKLPNPFYRIL